MKSAHLPIHDVAVPDGSGNFFTADTDFAASGDGLHQDADGAVDVLARSGTNELLKGDLTHQDG